jgi:hypothetical protein
MADTNHLKNLEKRLVDEGKLVEAGWVGLRIAAIPPDAPAIQLTEMRQAFFAGAQHVFSSMLRFLDDGEEITEDDLRRVSLLHDELQIFIAEFEKKHNLAGRQH